MKHMKQTIRLHHSKLMLTQLRSEGTLYSQARALVAEADNAGRYCLLEDESVQGGKEEVLKTLEGSCRDLPVQMPSQA